MCIKKNLPANAGEIGDTGLILGLGRSSGEGNSNPLQYSCLGNSMDRGAGGLQSMGLQRGGHDLATKTFTFKRHEGQMQGVVLVQVLD